MRFAQLLPSEDTSAGRFARQLLRAIGTSLSAPTGTVTAALFLAFGDQFATMYSRIRQGIAEAYVNTAVNLLSEHEAQYGLQERPDLPTADRQSRLTAKVRATRGSTKQRILRALSVIDPTVVIKVTTCAEAAAVGNPRKTHRFTVLLASAVYDDPAKYAAVYAIVQQMKQAHTRADIADGGPFTLDDAVLGRLDRNVLA